MHIGRLLNKAPEQYPGSDKGDQAHEGQPLPGKEKRKWSPGRDATKQGPPPPEQERLTKLARIALKGNQEQSSLESSSAAARRDTSPHAGTYRRSSPERPQPSQPSILSHSEKITPTQSPQGEVTFQQPADPYEPIRLKKGDPTYQTAVEEYNKIYGAKAEDPDFRYITMDEDTDHYAIIFKVKADIQNVSQKYSNPALTPRGVGNETEKKLSKLKAIKDYVEGTFDTTGFSKIAVKRREAKYTHKIVEGDPTYQSAVEGYNKIYGSEAENPDFRYITMDKDTDHYAIKLKVLDAIDFLKRRNEGLIPKIDGNELEKKLFKLESVKNHVDGTFDTTGFSEKIRNRRISNRAASSSKGLLS